MSDGTLTADSTQDSHHSTTIEITGNGQINAAFEDTETNIRNSRPQDIGNGSTIVNQEETPSTPLAGHRDINNHMNGTAASETRVNGVEPKNPPATTNNDVKDVAEAVNLELVNMQPFNNGIPVKKESTELDIGDPYDEYFVPVNQHKKYMRGEKLYVTQDKRRSLGGGGKKKCCWGLLSVIVLGIIVAILIGVLLSQDTNSPVESRTFNGDVKGASLGGVVPTPPPKSTQQPPRPTTDVSELYLQRALEGELTIDNMEFTPGLANQNTSEFKTLATSLEEELKRALFDRQTLLYGSSDITVKVLEFRSGSVIVLYRVGWEFKPDVHNSPDPLTKDSLESRLQEHIRNNAGFLYNYRMPTSSLKSSRILDNCQINNNNCSHICHFNLTSLQFLCSCPIDYTLAVDGKTCIESYLLENDDNLNHGTDEPIPIPMPVPSSDYDQEDHESSSESHSSSSESNPFDEYYPSPEPPELVPEIKPSQQPEQNEEEMKPEISSTDHLLLEVNPTESQYEVSSTPKQSSDIDNLGKEELTIPSVETLHEPEEEKSSEQHAQSESIQEQTLAPVYEFSPEQYPKPEDEQLYPIVRPTTEGKVETPPNTELIPILEEHENSSMKTESELTPLSPVISSGYEVSEVYHTTSESTPNRQDLFEYTNHEIPEEFHPTVKETVTEHLEELQSSKPLSELVATGEPQTVQSIVDQPVINNTLEHEVSPMIGIQDSVEITTVHITSPSSEAQIEHVDIINQTEHGSGSMRSLNLEHPTGYIMNSNDTNSNVSLVHSTDMINSTHSYESVINQMPAEMPTTMGPNIIMETANISHSQPEQNETEEHHNVYPTEEVIPVTEMHTHKEIKTTLEPSTEHILKNMSGNTAEEFSTDSEMLKEVNITHEASTETHIFTEMNRTELESSTEMHNVREMNTEPVFSTGTHMSKEMNISDPKSSPETHMIKEMNITEPESFTETPMLKEMNTTEPEFPIETQMIKEMNISEPKSPTEIHMIKEMNTTELESSTETHMFKEMNTTESESSTEIHMIKEMSTPPVQPLKITEHDSTMLTEPDLHLMTTMTPSGVIKTEMNLSSSTSIEDYFLSEFDLKIEKINKTDNEQLMLVKNDTNSEMVRELPKEEVENVRHAVGTETTSVDQIMTTVHDIVLKNETEHKTMKPEQQEHVTNISLHSETTMPSIKLETSNADNGTNDMTTYLPKNLEDIETTLHTTTVENLIKNEKEMVTEMNESEHAAPRESRDGVEESASVDTTLFEHVTTNMKEEPTTMRNAEDTMKEIELTTINNPINDTSPSIKTEEERNTTMRTEEHSPIIAINSTHNVDKIITEKMEQVEFTTEMKPIVEHTTQSSDNKMNQSSTEYPQIPLHTPNTDDIIPISITHIPDLSGPYSVDTFIENVTPYPEDDDEINGVQYNHTYQYRHEEEDDNNNHHADITADTLNSLDDDYNEEDKKKYYKPAKGKNLKNFKIQEVNIPIDSLADETSKDLQHSKDITEATVKIEEITTVQPSIIKEELKSNDAFTTTSPLFKEVKPDNKQSTPVTTKDKDEQINTLFFSNEAETTISPIFDNSLNTTNREQNKTLEIKEDKTNFEDSLNKLEIDNKESVTELIIKNDENIFVNSKLENNTNTTLQPELMQNKTLTIYEMPEMKNITMPLENITETSIVRESDKESISTQFNSSGLLEILNPSKKCATGQFACADGSGCIKTIQRCDAIKDCVDGSDELSCQEQGCPGNFQCKSNQCLKRSLVCDSISHCPDGSDESDCGNWKCLFDEVRCQHSKQCIPVLWRCDGKGDCRDNSDEFGCRDSCANDEFFCPEGRCIPHNSTCNSINDCLNGEDEMHCEST